MYTCKQGNSYEMTQVSNGNGNQYGSPPPADDMNAFYNEVCMLNILSTTCGVLK